MVGVDGLEEISISAQAPLISTTAPATDQSQNGGILASERAPASYFSS